MRLIKNLLRCLIPAVAVLSVVFLCPAFADMKKVDETELARTNASVSGESVKDRTASVEKGTARTDTEQTIGTLDKGTTVSSQFGSKANVMESIGLSLNIKGQETLKFYFGGSSSIVTGGATPAKRY